MIKFSKYVGMFIFLVEIIDLGYSKVCNQTLSIYIRLQLIFHVSNYSNGKILFWFLNFIKNLFFILKL